MMLFHSVVTSVILTLSSPERYSMRQPSGFQEKTDAFFFCLEKVVKVPILEIGRRRV
jgi:hypothetical protein